jgi:CheY-like chemotaxis protein
MKKDATTKHVIVYAEDDKDDLDLVKDAFNRYSNDIELRHGFDGREALQILKNLIAERITPCLIILDINMPGMDGRQTLIQIKQSEQTKNIPVVLFTTSNSQLDKDFAVKWGADFITKPLKFSEVVNLADEFIDRCGIGIKKAV